MNCRPPSDWAFAFMIVGIVFSLSLGCAISTYAKYKYNKGKV